MQPDRFRVAAQWYAAAEQDLAAASELAERMPNIACFHSQQACEKALKALLVFVAGDAVRAHLSDTLLGEAENLGINVPPVVREQAQALDKFYIAPRYPDALGTDITTAYKADESAAAIARALDVLAFVRGMLSNDPKG